MQTYLTTEVLVFATERKNNVDPHLRSQKMNYNKLVSCTYNFKSLAIWMT